MFWAIPLLMFPAMRTKTDWRSLIGFWGVLPTLTEILCLKKIIPADEMKNSGWSWKPEETAHTGSFSAEFFGIRSDGTVSAF